MFAATPKHVTTIGSCLVKGTLAKFYEWLSQFTNNVVRFFTLFFVERQTCDLPSRRHYHNMS